MIFTDASTLSLILFWVVLVCVALAFVAGYAIAAKRASGAAESAVGQIAARNATLGLLLWCAFFSAVSSSGVLQSHPVPALPLFFLAMILGSAGFALFSKGGRNLARHIPVPSLILFQAFRLPLEFILHDWVGQGVLPTTMTWTGQNWDIVSGVAALIFAPLSERIPKAAWVFNVLGFALLINVMRVVVMSSPLPFAWPILPSVQLALHFPYVLIAPVCVAGALAGHIVLTRALLKR